MNTTLWIIQAILAAIFVIAGVLKTTQPIPTLEKTVTWANRYPKATVRFIGIVELLAAIGLILPWALQIYPELTPYAAAGLAAIQLLAMFHHATHREWKAISFNVVLLTLTLVVAYNRFNEL